MPADAEDTSAFGRAVEEVRAGAEPEAEARALYERLDEDERLGLLDGDEPFWTGLTAMTSEGYNRRPYVHGAVERLGIPGIRFVDGPRGCVAGHGTAFPVSMARGATWDVELEERVGDAIGREVRSQGGNHFGGVCINLLRHPAWGRAQETYGDDPHHLGEMGAALVRGTQRHVMACAKHFALNSMENARFTVDVRVDDAALHDVYLPHFRRVVDEGVATIMGAYNAVNGEWAGQSRQLLTEVLREQWAWPGATVTDFIWGMRDGGAALEAGMDLEEPFAQQRAQHLRGQLERGEASWAAVERSGVRLLATQLRSYAIRTDGPFPAEQVMACAAHRDLAREVATRAMVLLENRPVDGQPVLPLDPAEVSSIAVLGRLATAPNLGDGGSSNVRPPHHVTPAEGIGAAFPDAEVVVQADDDVSAAAMAASEADVAIVVVGYDARDEGEYVGGDALGRPELLALFPPLPEDLGGIDLGALDQGGGVMTSGQDHGGDRRSLALRPVDEDLVRAVAAANPRTVVVLVAAGAVITEAWRHEVPAVLVQWYAGMEGGHALADVLTGRREPTGRLPFSVPTSAEHLPDFDRDATEITYDRWHGQRLLDRLGVEAAYPHGFGRSYTSFTIDEVHVAAADGVAGAARVEAVVRNVGERDGRQVVQAYGRTSSGPYAGELLLVGFAVVEVPAGEARTVEVPISLLALAAWDPDRQERILPAAGDVVLEVGAHAHDPAATTLPLTPT